MSKLIAGFFILFISLATNASVPQNKGLSIYNNALSNAEPGIYKRKGLLFFVADQACLSRKKHSGTKESRAARHQIMQLIVEEMRTNRSVYPRSAVVSKGALGDAVYQRYMELDSNISNSKVNSEIFLILDAEVAPCVGRVVMAISADKIHQETGKPPTPIDEISLRLELYRDAFTNQEFDKLAKYFHGEEVPELALAFTNKKQKFTDNTSEYIYPVNINWRTDFNKIKRLIEACAKVIETDTLDGKLEDLKKSAVCGPEANSIDYYLPALKTFDRAPSEPMKIVLDNDRRGVVAAAINNLGIIDYGSENPIQIKSAQEELAKASALFNKGIGRKSIVRHITNSLNSNPHEYKAWSILGSMFRAYKDYEAAYSCYLKALLIVPDDSDNWIDISKTLRKLDMPNAAMKINEIALELKDIVPPTE